MHAKRLHMLIICLTAMVLASLWVGFNLGKGGIEKVNQLQKIQALSSNASLVPSQLKQQEAHLASLEQQADSIEQKREALGNPIAFASYLEAVCRKHEVRLVTMPGMHHTAETQANRKEERFSLQGDFHKILRLLFQVEQKDQLGSVTRTSFTLQQVRAGHHKRQLLIADVVMERPVTKSD